MKMYLLFFFVSDTKKPLVQKLRLKCCGSVGFEKGFTFQQRRLVLTISIHIYLRRNMPEKKLVFK